MRRRNGRAADEAPHSAHGHSHTSHSHRGDTFVRNSRILTLAAFVALLAFTWLSWSPLPRRGLSTQAAPRMATLDLLKALQVERPGSQLADVVVVGGGLAGLSAAIEAHRAGAANVIILEKTGAIAGNSAKATSGINGVQSSFQKASGLEDSLEKFVNDTLLSGKGKSDATLVHILGRESADAIEFLHTEGSLELTSVRQLGGHSAARTHKQAPRSDGKPSPIGWNIMSALRDRLGKLQGIQVITNARMTKIIDHNDGLEVIGVAYEKTDAELGPNGRPVEHHIYALSTILTTGGYAYGHTPGAKSLLAESLPKAADLATTSGPQATGDGIRAAKEIGAAVVDMDQVQIHPTAFVDPANPTSQTRFLAPEALRGCGGILVNNEGKRFASELMRRDALTAAIMEQPQRESDDVWKRGRAYLVMSEGAAASFDAASVAFYEKKGLFRRFADLHDFAVGTGMPNDTLTSTLGGYGQMCMNNTADHFGRPQETMKHPPFATGPLLVAMVEPAVHYTMGGLKINACAEVQRAGESDESSYFKSIVGFFAAGEVTGGVHGANRLGGNSLLECVVFGRRAGRRAAECAKVTTGFSRALAPTNWTPLRLRQVKDVVDSPESVVRIFRFSLPSTRHVTGLDIGQYVKIRAVIDDEEVVRSYSPITRPDDYGLIELMIKISKQQEGKMTTYLKNLEVGDIVDFCGPFGGPAAAFLANPDVRKVGMIAGGAGITPMLQVIRAVFKSEEDFLRTSVSAERSFKRRRGAEVYAPVQNRPMEMKLIYGANRPHQLIFRDLLTEKAKKKGNFDVTFTVDPPRPDGWDGLVGYVDESMIDQFMFPPSKDLKIVCCGPPALCKSVIALLKSKGYTEEMFFSFY